jgi:hypothetical protein
MCFVFISVQIAMISPYNITDRFYNKIKSVYSAVRTESLNKAVCVSFLRKGLILFLDELNRKFRALALLPSSHNSKN